MEDAVGNLDGARCAECVHCHVLEGDTDGIVRLFIGLDMLMEMTPRDGADIKPDVLLSNVLDGVLDYCKVAICDLDGIDQIPLDTTPRDMDCESFNPR